jgi:hypothetical protein
VLPTSKIAAPKNKAAIMIIIPIKLFSKSIFEQVDIKEIKKINRSTKSYVVNLDVIRQLESIEMPFSNRDIATKNIFEFLEHLDMKIKESYGNKVEIPQVVFETFFNSQYYTSYKKILHELNIIKQTVYSDGTHYSYNNKNKDDNKCKIYRVGQDYLNSKEIALVIMREGKTKQIKLVNEIKKLDKRFVQTIKKLEIFTQPAVEAELEYYRAGKSNFSQLKVRLQRIFCTKRRRFIKHGEKVDRIFHSFSNISRVTRKHLSKEFNNIDIKNCQPLLLCGLMRKNNVEFDLNYQKDCENGVFYERFITDTADRDETKELIYQKVFFGFKKNNSVNQRFKELYPLVWNYLLEISKGEISLASRLQNLESELFNFMTPKKSKYFFTLFDAIYFDIIDDAALIIILIKKFFKSMGVDVQVALEKYNSRVICIHQ